MLRTHLLRWRKRLTKSSARNRQSDPLVKGNLSQREAKWKQRYVNRHPRLKKDSVDLIILCHRQKSSRVNAGRVWLPGERNMFEA